VELIPKSEEHQDVYREGECGHVPCLEEIVQLEVANVAVGCHAHSQTADELLVAKTKE